MAIFNNLIKRGKWTKIDKAEILIKYFVKDDVYGGKIEEIVFVLNSDDFFQEISRPIDWRIRPESSGRIQQIVNEINQKSVYNEIDQSYMGLVSLTANVIVINRKKGEFVLTLEREFDKSNLIKATVSQDESLLSQVDFIGEYRGDDFYLQSIRTNNPLCNGCGFGSIMFRTFLTCLPIFEFFEQKKLKTVTGSIGEGAGDNPQESIPFYNSLSGAAIPDGRHMVLKKKLCMEDRKFVYEID